MRVVLDTNTLISGVISAGGPPRLLLNGARTQVFEMCSSTVLLAELLEVLSREKFATRLAQADLTPLQIVGELRRIAYMVAPDIVPRVIEHDPDDDHRCRLCRGGTSKFYRLGRQTFAQSWRTIQGHSHRQCNPGT